MVELVAGCELPAAAGGKGLPRSEVREWIAEIAIEKLGIAYRAGRDAEPAASAVAGFLRLFDQSRAVDALL